MSAIFAFVFCFFVDPVAGNNLYKLRIGEEGIIHEYGFMSEFPSFTVDAWVNPEDIYVFRKEMGNSKLRRERESVPSLKGKIDLNKSQRNNLTKDLRRNGGIVGLDDLTPIKVIGYGRFMDVTDIDDEQKVLEFTDMAFIKVAGGPFEGKTFWVSSSSVRVRGKGVWLNRLEEIPKTPQPIAAPLPSEEIQIIDTSWNKQLNLVHVSCRIKNISTSSLKSVIVTIIYEDRLDKLVSTGQAIVGDLDPGQTKTFTGINVFEDGMDHYNFEFEGEKANRRKTLKFKSSR